MNENRGRHPHNVLSEPERDWRSTRTRTLR